MRYALVVGVVCVVLGVRLAWATGEISERVETFGDQVAAVWRVRVTSAERADTHLKFKDGSEGPITRIEFTYACEVMSTVYGEGPADGGKNVTLTFSMVVPIMYDEEGKQIGGFTIATPGSGLESGMKEGEEYLICLGDVRKAASYRVMRAEKPERRDYLVHAIAEAKCWKLLRDKHPEWAPHVRLAAFDPTMGLAVQVKGPPLDGLVLVTADAKQILAGTKGMAEDKIELSLDAAAREIVARSRDGRVEGIPVSGFEAAK